MRRALCLAANLLFILVIGPCLTANDVISTDAARQAGLQVQWFGQVATDATRDTVVDAEFHVIQPPELDANHDGKVDPQELAAVQQYNLQTTYFEILYGDQREVIAATDLNPRGEPFGVEGASQWANLRKEILEAEGNTVTINQYSTPQTRLYTFTGDGVIQAIDAETGRTLWTTRVGRRSYPSLGIGVNDDYVVAVKGTSVYCLRADMGEVMWTRRLRSAPGGGIALADSFLDEQGQVVDGRAYVTQLGNRVEVFPLNKTGIPSRFFVAVGRADEDPVVTSSTVSWPTDRGHYNVASLGNVKYLNYRLTTGVKIAGGGAAAGGRLIVTTDSGKVFAIDEELGSIAWEFATGEQIEQGPIALNDRIALIFTASDRLMAIDVQKGQVVEGWPQKVHGIVQFVGASNDLAYFLDDQRRLVGLRKDSGARVFALPLDEPNMIVSNTATDRLYVGSRSGALVCLREIGNDNPIIHASETGPTEPGEDQRNPFDTGKPAEGAAANPFDAKPDDAAKSKTKNPFEKDNSKKSGNPFDQ